MNRRRAANIASTIGASVALAALSCVAERASEEPLAPNYANDVAPILASRCGQCHSGSTPAAGWRATTYLETIACVEPTGAAAVVPRDGSAPILAALASPSHAGVVDATERATLEAWVAAGAPAFRGTVHPAGIIDPRSNDWHGKVLRDLRWRPMLEGADDQACGRCHEGTPGRPSDVTLAAPGATACTSCHKEAAGVLACNTCHGTADRMTPPRDPCFFPNDAARAGAHAAHIEPSPSRPTGFACGTCHPIPGENVIGDLHGNGSVEVTFDWTVVASEASFDRSTRTCAVGCHDRGGARPRPTWDEKGPLGCGDCHRAPPDRHPPGACSQCHAEADATGSALKPGALHMNGRTDLGNGSGQCGTCHGRGDDAWPESGAHALHRRPSMTTPIECSSCHVVPMGMIASGHLNGVVEVAFGGRAVARGARAAWDGRKCTNVACHGAALRDPPDVVPAWNDVPTGECKGCHGTPPSQHTASVSCERSTCHGDEVARDVTGRLGITNAGRVVHVNGTIDTQ